MNKPKKPPTLDELRGVSEHLHYEIGMFLSMADFIAKGYAIQGLLANAALETFLIHFRILYDFFYPQSPKEGDVLADHFFDSPADWKRPKKTNFLRDSKGRADREMAHLTYARLDVEPDEKYWIHPKIREQMFAAIKAFLVTVPEDRIGPNCKDLKRQLIRTKQNGTP